jgi:hypothetical protein
MTLYDNERADNDKQLVTIKIDTRVPSKWRFVDLETNQVWLWDNARGMFRRTNDVQVNDARAELVPMDPAEYREWENQQAKELDQEPPFPVRPSPARRSKGPAHQ